MTFIFIYLKGNHEERKDISILQWFGISFNEKAALSIANTLMLNSILFLGEIGQIFLVNTLKILSFRA
jgi:hypothetical protein